MEQEAEHAPSESQDSSEIQPGDLQTPDTPDLTSTPELQDIPCPIEVNTEPCDSVAPGQTATAPLQPEVAQASGDLQLVNLDRQSRAYALPDSYRGMGGDLCAGYGSLSRASLHSYWPAKNFQPGAHYTLPFLRDSYAPAGLSSHSEEDGLSERGENPMEMKPEHPAASYPTLGGIHQFRPITTMELLREPSRTR